MKTSKIFSLFLAMMLVIALFAGCQGQNGEAPASGTEAEVGADEAAPESKGTETGGYEEGTSASDEIVNTSPADKVILAVSFGTTFNQARDLNIGGLESALRAAYPDYQVRRAFTAQIVIDKLAERDSLKVDNIEEAMDRLVLDQVKEVVVQPTHVIAGYEYDDVVAAVSPYADKFEKLTIGKPLLATDADYDPIADLLIAETAKSDAEGTAVVLMGHGTHHAANATYAKMQTVLQGKGHANYLIGTVEGGPLIEDVQTSLKTMNVQKVVLMPMMIVAGDHANNDMAGAEAESWKTLLTGDGYTVETIVAGMGQMKGVQDILVEHTQEAIASAQ